MNPEIATVDVKKKGVDAFFFQPRPRPDHGLC
jgi:hypothetical protein